MKLDRNITRRGKYALIKLRQSSITPVKCSVSRTVQVECDAIDFGDSEDTDFFVIRLKDKYAYPALLAYGKAALHDDQEYGHQILELAELAKNHPNKRKPD